MLFPSLLSLSFRNQPIRALLGNEINILLLVEYLRSLLAKYGDKERKALTSSAKDPPKDLKVSVDEMQKGVIEKEITVQSLSELLSNAPDTEKFNAYDIRYRFPPSLWELALSFFTTPAPSSPL